MTNYFLMHKDRKLLAFSMENGAVLSKKVNPLEDRFLPISFGSDISRWLKNRSVPATRQGLSKTVPLDPFELMLANLGLSLTDAYWLKPVGSSYTWDSVNLYANDFRDTMSLDLTDNRADIAGKTNFLPSASLKGDLAKKWLIDEHGTRVLVKGNHSDTCIQSLSEVFATEIYRTQPYPIEYTPYSLIKITSNGKEIIGCKCPNYTSDVLEFIPAIDIVNSAKCPNDMNYFQFYIRCLENNHVDCRDFYDMEIMVDFIITNTDRHFHNFGVLRNTETLQFVKPAPVFDSGNSMFYKSEHIPLGEKLLNIDVTSFYKKEVKLLSQVKNRGLLDVRYLPGSDYVYNLLKRDPYLPEEKICRMIQAYKDKIKFFEDFQNGADLWSYNYLKQHAHHNPV
ncbi:MAG: hypothetical protein K2N87_16550 [Eubacterium sp.]|nr:hypothetical protein [Eubacterium sp.]